ncbi:hypothetical protein IHV09_14375 [Fictibacillus sp. 23RED33]|uniref:hypothetical protein n=1 Tax=Fictibacillus sp. 23RED33 TaxID=2745879 RepID=UPI0018CF2079|nr:hypothetical protein [Fictibacillus sp. 23RED33]MBH0174750.1 hypothetical protein [Fictibacillus sp. 23RED33]
MEIQKVKIGLSILDEKIKEDPYLREILWSILTKHYQDPFAHKRSTFDDLDIMFGEPAGESLDDFIYFESKSKELLQKNEYANKPFFYSLLTSFSEDALKQKLLERYGPAGFLGVVRGEQGDIDRLQILKADSTYAELSIDAIGYRVFIRSLIDCYDDYLDTVMPVGEWMKEEVKFLSAINGQISELIQDLSNTDEGEGDEE